MKFAVCFRISFLISLLLLPLYTHSTPLKTINYRKVDTIFQKKCTNCHGRTFRTSGLSLESYEALMRGGKRGALIVPGNSRESLLVKFLDGREPPQMPPGGQVTAKELRLIKAWIDAGAAAPGNAATNTSPGQK